MVPLTFYGDASWNKADIGPPIMVVAGFITSAKPWSNFEKEWNAMLRHFGVSYFRMVEFAHFKGPYEGWEERETDRRALIRRAAAIIARFTAASFGAGVLMDDWKLCNQHYMMKEEGFFPYPLCGWACMDHVSRWCRGKHRFKKSFPFKDVVFFFERGDPDQGHLERLAHRDFGKFIHFEEAIPKDGAAPLGAFQAADFAAWHVRNVMRNFEAGRLDRFREDFKRLFSRVEWKDHHADFSMKLVSERPKSGLYKITNEDAALNEEPSLIRFCQDYGKIPPRQ